MRIAYADPPYPGQSKKHYGEHADYAGEVDHGELIERLETFDGWVLHTSSVALPEVLSYNPPNVRIMAWVKPFTTFKKGVGVAYGWEPVIVKAARKRPGPESDRPMIMDWVSARITIQRGVAGAKPDIVCFWAFEVVGAEPGDELCDLFPGSGAVTQAWDAWSSQPQIGRIA